MTNLPLSELEAALKKATPGPWRWYASLSVQSAYLATVGHGRTIVMDFVRWGMTKAAPRFRVNDVMCRADALVDTDYNGEGTISHPDAALIVLLRNNADALVEAAKKVALWRDSRKRAAESVSLPFRAIIGVSDLAGHPGLFVVQSSEQHAALLREEEDGCCTLGEYVRIGSKLECSHCENSDREIREEWMPRAEESARKLAEAEREVEMLRALFAGAEEQHAELQAKFFALQAENAALKKAGQRVRNAHALECPNPECATMLAWDAVYTSPPPKSAGTKEDEHVG